MYKPSIRGTLTALATLALCGASVASAGAVSAGTVHASTVHASTARARPDAACKSTTKGVTEVVDFGKLKTTGKVKVACDPTNPKTGLAALKGAGFSYTFVRNEPGFVCRIGYAGGTQYPTPSQQKCTHFPPATAYWAYWHAKRGGKWILSKLGAGSYHPKPGSVQGWAYGKSRKPSISPP